MSIRAVSSYRGNFKQGSVADLLIKITDFDGSPVNPSSIQCTIVGPTEAPSTDDETIVTSNSPYQITDGYYVFTWDIDDEQALGNYDITWTYIVDAEAKYEYQTATVVEKQTTALPSTAYTQRAIALREALGYHISCAQSIPIYFEQSKPSRDRTTYEFTFANWNQSPGVRIYRNEQIVNSGAEVDYFRGSVIFDDALLPQETINADYNFRWFSEEELDRFLVNALQTVNVYPPHSGYTLDDIPNRYVPPLLYGAAKDALRQLMMCLNFQEPAQVFGGSENAQKAFSNFETLKQNYEKDWEKLLEQKKFGPYPSTKMVVTPEYTLPGGRCLHPDTELLVLVNTVVTEPLLVGCGQDVYTLTESSLISNYSNVYTSSGRDVQTLTLRKVYELFREGHSVEVLSHSDLTGNLVFAPINYIWESGMKSIYNLRTSNGYDVKASDEHLFFINDKYVPLRDIKVGDKIVTCDDHNWENSTVRSITQSKKEIVMYDLEVYGTANLFANGIKCHNSRWFRYLFK